MSMNHRSEWSSLRSYRQDARVTGHRLTPGTSRRILAYARPYRVQVAVFLVLVVVASLLVVATPLLLQRIVDEGVGGRDRRLVVVLASLVAVVAIAEAGLNLVQRWYSSRIGEGLIFDLRTAVFDHVQRQPVAFFTRTQTGSLVSRLNSDVIGAQQAFTSTLSNVVGSAATLTATLGAMFFLSWQITAMALVLLPLFLLPARRLAPKLSAITRERYHVDAAMG